jgi:glycosyltransferase involved in cell wall biosynthesis
LVHNGVADQSHLAKLRTTSNARWEQREPFRFLQIGFFHPAKGQSEAVEAFGEVHRRFPQTRLVLAGGGRQEVVRRRIHELGLEQAVELPGFVEDPFVELDRAHCLLQCSRHEAMGRATVEAMASGIPVIGHASGATPELIQEGVSGHLYRTKDELVALMQERILEIDRTRMMGAQAQAYATEHFATEVMVRGVMEVYWSLLPKAMHST